MRPIFVVPFDPRLPSIPNITRKHWRSMVSQSQYLNEVFQEPPFIAYKRQRNMKEYLIRAKVPPFNPRPKRSIKGMSKCGKQCLICPYIMVGKSITAEHFVWNLSKAYTCGTSNIVYLIECNKERCHKQYILDKQIKHLMKEFYNT